MKQHRTADQAEPVTDHLWQIGSDYYAEKFRVDHEPERTYGIGAVFLLVVVFILARLAAQP